MLAAICKKTTVVSWLNVWIKSLFPIVWTQIVQLTRQIIIGGLLLYREDSFFTLTSAGQAGLVILSTMLAVSTLVLVWLLVTKRAWPVRLLIGLTALVLFEWLSPQIYYVYYVFLLDVPWQIVIGFPPNPVSILKLLSFTDNANLSFHSRGAFGWLLIGLAILRK